MKFSAAFLPTLLGLAFAILPGKAQDLGATVSQPGVFSYRAPKGWAVKDSPLSKYKVSFDTPKNNFAANINLVVESYPKPLADYVAANKSSIKSVPFLQNVLIIDEKPFVTAGGLHGTRLVITDTVGKANLEQTFYFFAGDSDAKYVVTGSCLVDDARQYAPIFDASMKTFSTQSSVGASSTTPGPD